MSAALPLAAALDARPLAAALEALSAKAAAGQWHPDRAIDWTLPVRPPRWAPQSAYVKAVSQFHHGERIALAACRTLAERLPEPAARAFLATQIADEERHVAVYRRYLARLGDIGPVDPGLALAAEGAFGWTGSPLGLVLACHLLLETAAVGLHTGLVRRLPCPLLNALTGPVHRDEARHVAFGKAYVRARIGTLDEEERVALYRHIRSVWFAATDNGTAAWPPGAALRRRVRNGIIEAGWTGHRATLRAVGLIDGGPRFARVS